MPTADRRPQSVASLTELPLDGRSLLICDFDGVITDLPVDWNGLKRKVEEYCYRRHGKTIPFQPLGVGRDAVRAQLGDAVLSEIDAILASAELEALSSATIAADAQMLFHKIPPSVRVAWCSSNSRAVLTAALEQYGLEDKVELVVGREDVFFCKPDPQGLRDILRRTGVPASKALFVGDRLVDFDAGVRAGVQTVLLQRESQEARATDVPAESRDESQRLSSIAERHSYDDGFNGRMTRYRVQRILENIEPGGALLDVGCAEGAMTVLLAPHFDHVTAIDGSAEYLMTARRRLGPDADLRCTLFEEFRPDRDYSCIVASGILEHVEDPVALLETMQGWVSDGGKLVLLVPNAEAMHRRLGVAMGMLDSLDQLQQHDHAVGHRRYYDADMLRQHVVAGGWRVEQLGGVMLKVLSNAQMDSFSNEIIDGFDRLAREFPRLSAELLLVARRRR